VVSPVAINPATPPSGTTWPSRLIPGARAYPAVAARKKVVPVTTDERLWRGQDQIEILKSPKSRRWQSLTAAVLPQPGTHNQRSRLVARVSSDYASIAFAFSVLIPLAQMFVPPGSTRLPSATTGALLLYGMVFTLLGYSERLYHPETLQAAQEEQWIIAKVGFWSTTLFAAAFACSGIPIRVLAIFALASAGSLLTMLAWRGLWRSIGAHRAGSGTTRNVLIVGSGRIGRQLARYLEQDRTRNYVVTGFLDDAAALGGPIRGRVRDLARVARNEFVDEVILTSRQNETMRALISEARRNHIDVRIVPECFDYDPAAVRLERFGNIPVLTLSEEPIPGASLLLKRCIDVLLAATGLVLSMPLLVAIALMVKLDSPGPVLYCAPRLGCKGRRFLCYKFRTMVTDADALKKSLREKNERAGPFFKIADDPRITRAGRFLRRYSLDELPQLWNVLRGEMSLVGPRPHPLDDTKAYSLEDWQRLEVMPGLTGLWQVSARRDPSFARSMELDREYIGRWTLGMDFRILCRTVGAVLRGEGT